jgi:hypothetical protein
MNTAIAAIEEDISGAGPSERALRIPVWLVRLVLAHAQDENERRQLSPFRV